jgi:hypothetical protein
MKAIFRFMVLAAVVMITAFAFTPTPPSLRDTSPRAGEDVSLLVQGEGSYFGKHFESRCDTLTRGSDTIVNCVVRCSNPPTAKDTIWPNGEYKFLEATVTYTSSIDTVKFQTFNRFTNTWSQIGVWDLTAADNPYIMNCYNAAAETRRFRIGLPYPVKIRAILGSPASYSVRSVQVEWEGSGD